MTQHHIVNLAGISVASLALLTLLILEALDLADPANDALFNQAFNGTAAAILTLIQLLLLPFLPEEPPKPLRDLARDRGRPRTKAEVCWTGILVITVTFSSIAQAAAGIARGDVISPLIRLVLWGVFLLLGGISLLLWRWWRPYCVGWSRTKRLIGCIGCVGLQCVIAANGIVCQRNYGDTGCRSLVSALSGASFAAFFVLLGYIVSIVPQAIQIQIPFTFPAVSKNLDLGLIVLLLTMLGITYTLDSVDAIVGFSASATPAMLTLTVVLQIRISVNQLLESTEETTKLAVTHYNDEEARGRRPKLLLRREEKLWVLTYTTFLIWMVVVGVLFDFKGKVPLDPGVMVVVVVFAIGLFGVGLLYWWRKWGPRLNARKDGIPWTILGFTIVFVQLVHGLPLLLCEEANGKNPCQRLQVIGEAVNFALFLMFLIALRVSHRGEDPVSYGSRAFFCLKINACFFFTLAVAATVAGSFYFISDANFVYCPSPEDQAQVMAELKSTDAGAHDLVFQAGETTSDKNRTVFLRALQAHLDVGDALRLDVDRLLPVAELWSSDGFASPDPDPLGESGYLVGWFVFEVWPSFISTLFGRPLFPTQMSTPMSPLHPIWAMYRGRMMIANGVENGFLTEFYFPRGRDFLQCASNAFPANVVLKQYLGETMEWPVGETFPGDESTTTAPAWAVLQRSVLERLVNVLSFWVRERQVPNGEFGGGWNDDVEIWRWGSGVLLGFEDGFALEYQAAQRALSEGVFALERMQNGFTAFVTDVEHTAEDTADSIIPMLLLYPEEEIWKDRALRLTELMEMLWTGNNTDGDLVYKSNYFSSETVDTRPELACDIPKNVRAIAPALVLLQSDPSRYPQITAIVRRWMDTWVAKTASADCGKPVGVVPASIHYPDGRTGGPATSDWFLPGCKTACLELSDVQAFCADDTDAFEWPSSIPDITQTLILTALATGDHCKYLYPVRSMADIRRRFLSGQLTQTKKEGTLGWAGRKLRSSFIEALGKLKLLSNSSEFDDLLPSANGYARFYLTGDLAGLEKELEETVLAYSVNYEQYTSEVRFTDRIRKFHDNYWNLFFDTVAPQTQANTAWPPLNISMSLTEVPGLNEITIYQMVTGDIGSPVLLPLPGVRWQTDPRGIAALVSDNSAGSFEAQLFQFGVNPRSMGAKLLRLSPGGYLWNLTCASSMSVASGAFTNVNISVIDFVLPSKDLCVLSVTATVPFNVDSPDEACPTLEQFHAMFATEQKECPVEVPERLPVLLITVPQAFQFGLVGLTGLVLILAAVSLVLYK